MAGDDDGQWISAIGGAHRTGSAGSADFTGHVSVGGGLAVWNVVQLPEHGELEVGAVGVQ